MVAATSDQYIRPASSLPGTARLRATGPHHPLDTMPVPSGPLKWSLVALAGLLLQPAVAAAQNGSRDFVCAYLWDHSSGTFFVGRQVIEVRSSHPHNASLLDRGVPTQFHRRVSGQLSRDDLLAHHAGGYANWGLAQSVIRQSLGAAKQECLKVIAEAARQGFDAYGVGEPIYAGDDDERVQAHSFLSILEFPNYAAGTIAAAKRRSDRGEGAPRRDRESRNDGGWKPGEYAEYYAKMQERGRQITAEADALYDAGEYDAARAKYRSLLNIGAPEWAAFQPHAHARIAEIDRLAGIRAYAAFNQATGISFGAYGSQSYFDRDVNLIGVSVAKKTFGLNAFYGIATGSDGLKSISGADMESSVGEYTEFQVMAGSAIPKLRLGPFGLHAAYIYQKTDRRGLNLGMAGVHMGNFGTGPTFHIDVTQVFGTPRFGFGVDLNFNDLGS